MRCRAFVLSAAVLTLAACQSTPMHDAADAGWSHYGTAGRDAGMPVALGAVSGDEKNVIVEGTITEVCPMKGCWMRVTDGEQELFVRFQDYGFFVPMNSAGHKVVMHGTATSQVASVEELRHYARDAGKSDDQIAAITEPQHRVTFYADSVYIEGPGLDDPFAGS